MAKPQTGRGRGRLSGIDLLPPEADDIIVWAADELNKRERTEQDIYAEFFTKLQKLQGEHHGELEFTIPSKSAFNRYSVKLARMTRRIEETREIASTIARSFDAKASDDLTLIAAEAIKTLIFEALQAAGDGGGDIDPAGAKNLAAALRAAVQAQGVSTDRRQKVERDFKGKVDEALKKAGEKAGADGTEVLRKIREEVYGIFDK